MMEKATQNVALKILVPVCFVLMIVVNGLANALPLNGMTTGGISDAYTNLFTPQALTFAIWGLIYFLVLLYVLYHLGLFRSEESNIELLNKTGLLFVISCLANSAWIFAWHYNLIPLSLLIMAILLVTFINIALTISRFTLSSTEKWLVRLPFSVYFGWITVATIANTTVQLVGMKWSGYDLSPVFWTVAILIVGSLIGLMTMFRFRDYAYGLVFIWALYGIWMCHISPDPEGWESKYPHIILTAILCLCAFAIAEVILLVLRLRKKSA